MTWKELLSPKIPEGFKTAKEIAEETGLHPSTVRVALAGYVDKGMVEEISIGRTRYFRIRDRHEN